MFGLKGAPCEKVKKKESAPTPITLALISVFPLLLRFTSGDKAQRYHFIYFVFPDLHPEVQAFHKAFCPSLIYILKDKASLRIRFHLASSGPRLPEDADSHRYLFFRFVAFSSLVAELSSRSLRCQEEYKTNKENSVIHLCIALNSVNSSLAHDVNGRASHAARFEAVHKGGPSRLSPWSISSN